MSYGNGCVKQHRSSQQNGWMLETQVTAMASHFSSLSLLPASASLSLLLTLSHFCIFLVFLVKFCHHWVVTSKLKWDRPRAVVCFCLEKHRYEVSRALDVQLEEGTLFLQHTTFLSRALVKLSSTLLLVVMRIHLVLSVFICVAFSARWHSGFDMLAGAQAPSGLGLIVATLAT